MKKYTVMPSDRGGLLDDECPPRPMFRNSLAEDLEFEDVDLLLHTAKTTARFTATNNICTTESQGLFERISSYLWFIFIE